MNQGQYYPFYRTLAGIKLDRGICKNLIRRRHPVHYHPAEFAARAPAVSSAMSTKASTLHTLDEHWLDEMKLIKTTLNKNVKELEPCVAICYRHMLYISLLLRP